VIPQYASHHLFGGVFSLCVEQPTLPLYFSFQLLTSLAGSIPDEVKAFMEAAVRAGMQLGRIVKFMAHMGFKTTWAQSQIKDLQKRISRALKDSTFDEVWTLLTALQETGAYLGLYIARQIATDGTITALYVVLPLAYAVLTRWGSVRVFDVTYNTNRYGLYCGIETCKMSSGTRVIVALSFLTELTEEAYYWHLQCSSKASPRPLIDSVYIVDQDEAMIAALERMGIRYFFGQWHLWQLIDKKAAGSMGKKWEEARQALQYVWRAHSELEWEQRWANWQVRDRVKGR
jgi:hypothetical protein